MKYDVNALIRCLERGLNILQTECNDWPKMNDYFETADEDMKDDKTIKISLKQHPSFGMVIICGILFVIWMIICNLIWHTQCTYLFVVKTILILKIKV